jgi:nucleotide-binding universal stress UspA family protein
MYQRILLPIEDTEVSRRAVQCAVNLAKACHARLLALHVVLPDRAEAFIPGREWAARRQEDASSTERCIDYAKAEAAKAEVPCDSCIMCAGEPWDAISQAARDKQCDLIVMGSHGRRGLARLLLGSETHTVLAHTQVPVLVCP